MAGPCGGHYNPFVPPPDQRTTTMTYWLDLFTGRTWEQFACQVVVNLEPVLHQAGPRGPLVSVLSNQHITGRQALDHDVCRG
jgi:hypothetical protein